jgi:hypothetical protein
MKDSEYHTDDDAPKPQGSSILTVPAIFFIGLIIYEVTNDPAMAAMGMCLKFGTEDFRTALWLKRHDPQAGRGTVCCWLYVASGLWQTAVIGVAMVLLTVVLCELIQGQQQVQAAGNDILSLLEGAFLAIFFGFVFSTLATYIALAYARRHRVRPWLNGAVHIARRNEHWPPLYGHGNRVMILVYTTIVVTFTILVPALLIIAVLIVQGIVPGKFLAGLAVLVPLFFYLLLLPTAIFTVVNMRRDRFFADHPADCWGDDPRHTGEPELEAERP